MVKPNCYTYENRRCIIIYPSIEEIILRNTTKTYSDNLPSEELDSILELIHILLYSKEANHYFYEDDDKEVHVILGNLQICIDPYTINISNKTSTRYLVRSSLEKTINIFETFLKEYNNG